MRTGFSTILTQLIFSFIVGGLVFASLFFNLMYAKNANANCLPYLTSATETNATRLPFPTENFRKALDVKESRGVKFSPNGEWVATISDDRSSTVRVLDATTGQLLFSSKLESYAASTIAWSPKGELFVAHNSKLDVFLRGVNGQWGLSYSMIPAAYIKQTPRMFLSANLSLTSISFSSDGNYFIGSILHHAPMVFRTVDGAWMYTIASHALLADAGVSPRFTSDGKRIILIGGKSLFRTLEIFDASDGKRIDSRSVFLSDVDSFDVSPDGRSYSYGVSRRLTNSVNVVSRDFGAYFRNWKQNFSLSESSYFTKVKYSSDGKRIFAASHGSSIKILDAISGRLLNQVNYKVKHVSFIVSPDSRFLAVLTGLNEIEILDGQSGAQLANISLKTTPFYIDFHSEASGQQRIAVGGADGSVSVWSF